MKEEIIKEVAKDVYQDAGKPIAKPTGELVGLVPRAIKAALAPLEKWILQREYNVAQTQRLLEEKLKNVPPELIEPPEAHIAIPAMQYMSYCMDNDELRDMYANLLANSMNRVVKNGVHPGFVEIIKQLCPDEAKILKYVAIEKTIPTITLRYENERGEGINVVKNFSDIGDLCGCERPYDINKYFNNQIRLGLVETSPALSSLTNKELYTPLKKHPFIITYYDDAAKRKDEYNKAKFKEGYLSITDYGKAFCGICLSPAKTIVVGQGLAREDHG